VAGKSTLELSPERLAVAEILRRQVIPAFGEHGVERLVLSRSKMSRRDLPPGVKLTHPVPLGRVVKRRARNSIVLSDWPDDGMEALRYPGFCFVTAGEADIRSGDAILHCPAGSGVLFPPGVPRPAGHRAHWARSHPENANSDIVWANFNSTGATCHRCQTRGTKHLSDYGWYSVIVDRQMLPLAEKLITEMERKEAEYSAVGDAYLSVLLHLLLRHMSDTPELIKQGRSSKPTMRNPDAQLPDTIVSRAQEYIENHLSRHMTLQEIAHAAYVSRAQLAQLFRERLGKTVWEYVMQRRLDEAKTLLVQTDHYVYRIAYLTGFASPSTFIARFTAEMGVSPAAFRHAAKSEEGAH
jgi:AraC-like DNA-binding protein